MASPALGASSAREEGSAPDVTGVLVLGCCAAWALITATGRDARPEGVLLAVLALGAGYACGRITGALLPTGAFAAAALAGVFLAFAYPHAPPGFAQPAGSSGRTDGAAALLVLATGAASCGAQATTARLLRAALWLLAVGIAAATLLTDRFLASAAAFGVLLTAPAAARVRQRAAGLATLALTACAVSSVVWAVARGAAPHGLTASLAGQLTEHKLHLWQDALALARDHPLLGSGPGTFGQLSPAAQQAVESTGRPHSALFQTLAEQGTVGVLLLAAAFGWLLLALWASPRPTPVVLTAGATLTALAVLAGTSNALSFTQVTTGAGLLAGVACARRLP